MRKILIPIQGDFVAPRFDLATELILAFEKNGSLLEAPHNILMEKASDEELCQRIISETITDLICGGIEETHYNFLLWKKIAIFDGVIADWQTALDKAVNKTLKAHTNYLPLHHSFTL